MSTYHSQHTHERGRFQLTSDREVVLLETTAFEGTTQRLLHHTVQERNIVTKDVINEVMFGGHKQIAFAEAREFFTNVILGRQV